MDDVKTTLRQQMQALHGTLEAAIRDCPAEVLAKKFPGSTINSVGAIYAHTIFGEDGILNGLVRGGTPVYFAGGWAPKVGLDMPKGGMEPDWAVTLDLDLFRQYAAAVTRPPTSTCRRSATTNSIVSSIRGLLRPCPCGHS